MHCLEELALVVHIHRKANLPFALNDQGETEIDALDTLSL